MSGQPFLANGEPPGRHGHAQRGAAAVALGGGLVLVVIAVVAVLFGSPLIVAQTNATPANEPLLEARHSLSVCQGKEVLPADVSAIRLTLVSAAGPRVRAAVFADGRQVAGGEVGSGWTGGAVTVPVAPVHTALAGARVCFALGKTAESVTVGGSRSQAAVAARERDGRPLPGRFTVEYMRSGSHSWWSLAQTVGRRLGLGRAPGGTWVALLLGATMAAVIATAAWLAVREL